MKNLSGFDGTLRPL